MPFVFSVSAIHLQWGPNPYTSRCLLVPCSWFCPRAVNLTVSSKEALWLRCCCWFSVSFVLPSTTWSSSWPSWANSDFYQVKEIAFILVSINCIKTDALLNNFLLPILNMFKVINLSKMFHLHTINLIYTIFLLLSKHVIFPYFMTYKHYF